MMSAGIKTRLLTGASTATMTEASTTPRTVPMAGKSWKKKSKSEMTENMGMPKTHESTKTMADTPKEIATRAEAKAQKSV